MARKLIVPLDGSELAEAALPWAAHLARIHGFSVVLARAIRWPVMAASPMGGDYLTPQMYGDILAAERGEATDYLDRVRGRLARDGVAAEAAIREGDAADGILDLAAETDAYAIVMATHGRGGMTRVILGSVAERVLQQATVPVLLVRAGTAQEARQPALDRLLVPLDGSPLAELALELARDLAPTGGTLVLVRVEEPVVRAVGGGATAETVLDEVATQRVADQAEEYLRQLAGSIADGLEVVTEARVGPPADEILEATDAHYAGLLVMSTHGRTGPARWLLGSVADQIVRRFDGPVLLVSARALAARAVGSYSVGDIMTRDLATVRDDESLIVALRKLLRRRVSGLPVVDAAGDLVGVLSERDLLDWQARLVDVLGKQQELTPGAYAEHLEKELVRQVMSRPATTIEVDAPLNAVIRSLRERHVRRLPVTHEGRLVGIVSRADVLKAMASHWQAVRGEGPASER
jgi:nucleotide-binding universal stress UspA family protein/predicted transcriptional regulator